MVSILLDSPELHADEPNLLDCKSALQKSFSVKEKHEYIVTIDAWRRVLLIVKLA